MTVTKTRGPTRTHSGGRRIDRFGGVTQQGELKSRKGLLTTEFSPGPPYLARNPCKIVASDGIPGRYSGKVGDITFDGWYFLPVGNVIWSSTASAACPHAITYQASWETAALAGVNPNRSEISIANFLWELREFPSMLRDLGRVLQGRSRTSDIPGAHLAWQFGWAPLLSDLTTLWNLATEIEKTRRRFVRGNQRKTMSGTLLDRRSLSYSTDTTGLGAAMPTITREWDITHKAWYTAHWTAATPLPPAMVGTYAQQMERALGLRQPASIIWNAIPWSFFIDYLVNVGTFLEASGGGTGWKPDQICIMWQTTTKLTEKASPTVGTFSPGGYNATEKNRRIVSSPSPKLMFEPFKFLDQLAIISSLGSARALRAL